MNDSDYFSKKTKVKTLKVLTIIAVIIFVISVIISFNVNSQQSFIERFSIPIVFLVCYLGIFTIIALAQDEKNNNVETIPKPDQKIDVRKQTITNSVTILIDAVISIIELSALYTKFGITSFSIMIFFLFEILLLGQTWIFFQLYKAIVKKEKVYPIFYKISPSPFYRNTPKQPFQDLYVVELVAASIIGMGGLIYLMFFLFN